MQRNQFGTTKAVKILHGTVKSAILDVSASFSTSLWFNLALDTLGHPCPILQKYQWIYKTVDPLNKRQKDLPSKMMYHIYMIHNSHIITSLFQLVTGAFLFGMGFCEYSTTPKGETKQTIILKNEDVHFYRKRSNLTHRIRLIHLSEKVSPTFQKHTNGIINATVNQWRTVKHLFSVLIWGDLITILESYPDKLEESPVNVVWFNIYITTITCRMKIKTLRSLSLYFG